MSREKLVQHYETMGGYLVSCNNVEWIAVMDDDGVVEGILVYFAGNVVGVGNRWQRGIWNISLLSCVTEQL